MRDLKELLEYYEGQYTLAAKDYVKSGKAADRMNALKYGAKVEVLKQALGIGTKPVK